MLQHKSKDGFDLTTQHIFKKNKSSKTTKKPHPVNFQNNLSENESEKITPFNFQVKLKISQPSDPYEVEANRIAEQVMRIPKLDSSENEKTCRNCSKSKEKEEVKISRNTSDKSSLEASDDTSNKISSMRNSGRTLDPSTRSFMEPRFGHDFSEVRIHDDARSNELAESVGAKAFTVGNDVFFGKGGSVSDTKLMAHELTHVVQNNDMIHRYDIGPPVNMDWGLAEDAAARYDPNRPIEVSVIDDSDIVGWLAGLTRIGEVYMTNVQTMVDNVLTEIGTRKMSRLNILDHGNTSGIQIGNDWITPFNVRTHLPNLRRLQNHFSTSGFVHIQHCQIGQNQGLVCTLAAAFGVPVYAGTGNQNPIYRFNFGDYVKCDPNGTFHSNVGRP